MLCRVRSVYSKLNSCSSWPKTKLIMFRSSVFLHAIFPSIANIPDIMGSKSALNSAQMLCFFLYWYVPITQIRVSANLNAPSQAY